MLKLTSNLSSLPLFSLKCKLKVLESISKVQWYHVVPWYGFCWCSVVTLVLEDTVLPQFSHASRATFCISVVTVIDYDKSAVHLKKWMRHVRRYTRLCVLLLEPLNDALCWSTQDTYVAEGLHSAPLCIFTLHASCGTVHCNRTCLWVCLFVGVCAKLKALILTKLGL